MLERELQARVMRELKKHPQVYALNVGGGASTAKGTPDIIGCAAGRFFAIELKRDEHQHPTKPQLIRLKQIADAGGATLVAHDLETVMGFIENLVNENAPH